MTHAHIPWPHPATKEEGNAHSTSKVTGQAPFRDPQTNEGRGTGIEGYLKISKNLSSEEKMMG